MFNTMSSFSDEPIFNGFESKYSGQPDGPEDWYFCVITEFIYITGRSIPVERKAELNTFLNELMKDNKRPEEAAIALAYKLEFEFI